MFFLQPDLEALRTLRKRLCSAASSRQNSGWAAPASGRPEFSDTIHGAASELWEGPEI